MKTYMKILSEEKIRTIHQESLKILSEIGACFHSVKALDHLKRGGAKIDKERHIAYLPPQMVEQALKDAPKSFTLGARNPKYNMDLPTAKTMFGLDGQATFTLDSKTGRRREGLLSDIADSCRILQTLPQCGFFWPNVKAHDVNLKSMLFAELCTAMIHTSKHAQHEVHHPGQLPYLLEILEAVAGSADEVKKRKIFSMVYCTLPPLRHDGEMCDAYLELLPYEIPILVLPMNAPGSTGPASLRSNLALANAEILSAITLFQTVRPGTPMLYSTAMGGTNFSDGGFMTACAEAALLNAAAVEIARYYQLPCGSTGCASEAKMPGEQAVLEKMQSTLMPLMAGPDIFTGLGEIDSAQMLLLEQILIDYDIVRHCQRLKDGLDFSENKNLMSDILKTGVGGNFFASSHTVKMCRSSEFLPAGLLHKGSYENWEKAGRRDMNGRAKEKVKEILAAPMEDQLPGSVLAKLETILEKMNADKNL